MPGAGGAFPAPTEAERRPRRPCQYHSWATPQVSTPFRSALNARHWRAAPHHEAILHGLRGVTVQRAEQLRFFQTGDVRSRGFAGQGHLCRIFAVYCHSGFRDTPPIRCAAAEGRIGPAAYECCRAVLTTKRRGGIIPSEADLPGFQVLRGSAADISPHP